jgi:hypothetical protein
MALPRLAITAVIVDSIFTAIGLLFVVLRLSTRISVVKNISANDYLIVAAMVCELFIQATFWWHMGLVHDDMRYSSSYNQDILPRLYQTN